MATMMTTRSNRFLNVGAGCLVLATALRAALVAAPVQQQQSPPSDPYRAAAMQHHFVDVARVHEAVIRGDLRGALPPAALLSAMATPAGLPIDAEPFVSALRQAAKLVTTAPSLRAAASGTVAMLQQCAGCHRAVGVYPAPRAMKRPDVGGVTGHMLQHLQAADELLEGLVIPSASLWQAGADRLATASVHPSDWPRNSKVTPEMQKIESSVHALADKAKVAQTAAARGAVYADLLTACASCHGAYARGVGPRTR